MIKISAAYQENFEEAFKSSSSQEFNLSDDQLNTYVEEWWNVYKCALEWRYGQFLLKAV